MDAAQAISLVTNVIQSQGLDYPTEGLKADRFEVGWSVYAPVAINDSDPLAFLNIPVGRSVFLVGDSGRIKEVTSSTPPQQARNEFIAEEQATAPTPNGSKESRLRAEMERQFSELKSQNAISEYHITDTPPADEATAAEAAQLIDPIVQQLAQLGPAGWERLSAVFAFTVSAQVAQVRFWAEDRSALVPVTQSIAELVRSQREITARMSAGPWWRLILNVNNFGETTVDYDYGDEPFPNDQLLASEHYRNDLESYPRNYTPAWLAGYIAGPAAQGRDPHQAAVAANADAAAGRTAVEALDLPALQDVWARWAVLAAVYAGVRSDSGPRIMPGYAWHEDPRRSGSTLYLLAGERAVLSGGKWNSALLDAAYNGGEPMPDLYTGAPAWVNDSVLNTRNRNGLLSFCFWWVNGQWYRGATDTSGELDAPVPAIWIGEETIWTMASQTGPDTEDQCETLLIAAANHNATRDDVAAVFVNVPDADVDGATNQLSLAGLLAS